MNWKHNTGSSSWRARLALALALLTGLRECQALRRARRRRALQAQG